MSETAADKVNRILRDHEGYTGDGKGGDGALPVGDRSTAVKPIVKRDLREALIAPLQDTWDARDKAQEWAEGTGEPGGPGTKSSKSWSEVSEDWAESPTAPGGPGSASAKTWSDKANQWAENPEDAPVEPGEFSALHWAAKAAQAAGSVGNPVSYDPNQGLNPTQQQDARTNLGLGTAATVDHGTDPGEVPLNSDLGSMSLEDAGDYTKTADLPQLYYTALTASGTWTKPPGFSDDAMVIVQAWGAGGGGRGGTRTGGGALVGGNGGDGGGYGEIILRYSSAPATVPYVIGAGGVGGNGAVSVGAGQHGTAGGYTEFGAFMRVNGGAGTDTPGNAAVNLGTGTLLISPGWLGGVGGVSRGAHGESSIFGGGGGGGGADTSGSGQSDPGLSLNGGSGGASINVAGSPAEDGEIPGGGGGGGRGRSGGAASNGGDGARGEVRIWIVG